MMNRCCHYLAMMGCGVKENQLTSIIYYIQQNGEDEMVS
jgi:hypothetical protein